MWFSHFSNIMNIFKHTEKLKELDGERPCTHHLNATIATLMYLLCQNSSTHPTTHLILLKQWFSKCDLETPEGPWDPFWVQDIKTIFKIILRGYFPFSLSFSQEWWGFPDTRYRSRRMQSRYEDPAVFELSIH